MVKSKDYEIHFSALKLGTHLFNFDIEDVFFTLFDYSEIEKVNLNLGVTLIKKSNLMQLDFVLLGQVALTCDRCAEDYLQKINQHFKLIVKFSDSTESDENDEIIILPTREHTISLTQYIYEFVHLSLPLKRTHKTERNELLPQRGREATATRRRKRR